MRLHHSDVLWHIANLLVDPAPSVRVAAAQALAYKQDPAGAPMLLLRLRMGDDDPVAVTAHLVALLGLAPRQGLRLVRERLHGADDDARHAAAFALGESRHPAACAELREWLDRAVTAEDRRVGFTALAMLRDQAARDHLLEVIGTGSESDSCQALRALAPYRFDTDLYAAAHAAASRHPDRQPQELATQLLGEPPAR